MTCFPVTTRSYLLKVILPHPQRNIYSLAITRRLAVTLWALKESSEADKKNRGEENEQCTSKLNKANHAKETEPVEKRDL